MIQKKKFSDAIAANISVVGGLIGGNRTLSKKIIYGGLTVAAFLENKDYDDMLDMGDYLMHNGCTHYPPSNATNNWHFLRVTKWFENANKHILQEAFPFGGTPSMWVRVRVDGNFSDWKKVY